jgi:hypothetical protein
MAGSDGLWMCSSYTHSLFENSDCLLRPVIKYHEPSASTLLTLASFLYLLQIFRDVADRLCSAGLLGEIALGMIFGRPLAGILDDAWEETFMFLGYLGLILIVFEGEKKDRNYHHDSEFR